MGIKSQCSRIEAGDNKLLADLLAKVPFFCHRPGEKGPWGPVIEAAHEG